MSRLSQEDLRTLEQTRQRLFQLTNSIQSLKASILSQPILPAWSSLHTTSSILAGNMAELAKHLTAHSDLFSRLVVYPQTNYPGRTQEALLTQLLRKKLEPNVEDWAAEGRAAAQEAEASDGTGTASGDSLEDLWQFAEEWAGQRIALYVTEEQGDDYTAEEREMGIENVNTGLRHSMGEEDSEDEDEDERKPQQTTKIMGPGKVRAIEEIMGFMTTGITPEERMAQTTAMR